MNELLKYLNSLRLDARDQFAERCGTTAKYLRKACSAQQALGAEICVGIERETSGQVTCEMLRPDVDWAYIRNTAQDTPAPQQTRVQAAPETIAAGGA